MRVSRQLDDEPQTTDHRPQTANLTYYYMFVFSVFSVLSPSFCFLEVMSCLVNLGSGVGTIHLNDLAHLHVSRKQPLTYSLSQGVLQGFCPAP